MCPRLFFPLRREISRQSLATPPRFRARQVAPGRDRSRWLFSNVSYLASAEPKACSRIALDATAPDTEVSGAQVPGQQKHPPPSPFLVCVPGMFSGWRTVAHTRLSSAGFVRRYRPLTASPSQVRSNAACLANRTRLSRQSPNSLAIVFFYPLSVHAIPASRNVRSGMHTRRMGGGGGRIHHTSLTVHVQPSRRCSNNNSALPRL